MLPLEGQFLNAGPQSDIDVVRRVCSDAGHSWNQCLPSLVLPVEKKAQPPNVVAG